MRIHRLRIRYRLAPEKRLHLGGGRLLVSRRAQLRPSLALHDGNATPAPA